MGELLACDRQENLMQLSGHIAQLKSAEQAQLLSQLLPHLLAESGAQVNFYVQNDYHFGNEDKSKSFIRFKRNGSDNNRFSTNSVTGPGTNIKNVEVSPELKLPLLNL